MARVRCEGRAFEVAPGRTVLDGLLDAGIAVPSSCRAGACQSCLVQATEGTPPAAAQVGLKEALRQRGFFLACQAVPTADLEVSVQAVAALKVGARITSVEHLAPDVLRVRLRPSGSFEYRAGQFVTLMRGDGLARAYSLASLPAADGELLELHVRVLPRGLMSTWLASPEALHSEVELRGPSGDCFYTAETPEQPIVLVGVGTGLAPLWGIARDALAAGHAGALELWHGAKTAAGLYLRAELLALSHRHSGFTYQACVLEGEGPAGVHRGRLDEVLLGAIPSFAGRRVFLCGDAELVRLLKRKIFLAGANLPDISADAFLGPA